MTGYIVECRSGCTCCSYQNHACGPFSTRAVAESAMEEFYAKSKVASQFAPNGRYRVDEYEVEVLTDGRLILDNCVFAGWADAEPWEPIQNWR